MKKIGSVKRSARYQDLTKFKLPIEFRGRSALTVQLWWLVQSALFHSSPQIFFGWRRLLLRLFGARIGHGALIRSSVEIVYPWHLSVGDNSWIGDHVVLYSLGEIRIGNNTVISQHSHICAGTHDPNAFSFDIVAKPITIGSECWIASEVFIAPGVTIGDGTVVGSRSSVFHDLPGGMICHGQPARIIRRRNKTKK